AKICTVEARKEKNGELKSIDMTAEQQYIRGNLERVTIDEAAFDHVEGEFTENVDKYNCALTACHMIRDKSWFFAADKVTGRVYHNACNLNRDLRPFLRVDGRALVEVDISNSQPMLLHTLYPDKERAEAKRYKALVESGKFYEVFH